MEGNNSTEESVIKIKSVNNGFIVIDFDGQESVFEQREEDNSEIEAGLNMLWFVIELLGLRRSRHDKERILVVVEAGDKYEISNTEEEEWEHLTIRYIKRRDNHEGD